MNQRKTTKPTSVRLDNHRVRLRTGESQRKNGSYVYRWTTQDGIRHSVYASSLELLRERFLKESDQVFPIVTVRFFVPDTKLHKHSKKSGGAYKSYTGPVRQIDFIEGKLIFKSDRPGQKEVVVPIADVVELNSEELDQVENRYE